MNDETVFLIVIGPLVFQILILFLYYFAALRRLFIPPTPSNILVIGIVLIGLPGYALIYLWGWIRHQKMHMTQLMIAWTLVFAIFVLESILLSNIERTASVWLNVAIPFLGFVILSWLTIWMLIPFLRADERMRALMRESSLKNIQRLAKMGKQAIPNIKLMLDDDYQQYRLDAIECLARMGATGVPYLEKISNDGNSVESNTAENLLKELENRQA
ncbi:hypothetical protein [Rubinisphaera sp.]|uniref:hypothetical protein n=1 Tax=Rubinisphaera sp. TaxID=2024857 RepID=UPI000C0F638E|nr:hypothetical protein [Rubinisphaera sp.]MBV11054.1 hypothetical protein [Rubinisphaera sp.]HCS50510.1 hypothetical protein [Planctomycetaceae bacterium]|tara:strand:+ start:1844 stop:2491 length:648 start_codon:yes stop_codon:yes gene_type:complete